MPGGHGRSNSSGSSKKSRRRRPEEFGLLPRGGGGSLRDEGDSDSDAEPQMSLEKYLALGIASGLTRGGEVAGPWVVSDYAQAASELSHVMQSCLKVAEKPAQAKVYEDALLAARRLSCLETSAQLAAAARLQRAARIALPQAKYKTFDNEYRKAAMMQKKKEKKKMRRAEADARETADHPEELEPVNIAELPGDVLKLVMARLRPHDLARASCVSRTWRECSEAAEGGGPWKAACLNTFGEKRCEAAMRLWEVPGSVTSAAAAGAVTPGATVAAAASTPTATVSAPAAGETIFSNWRLIFLAARRRWPGMAVEPTGRVFCTSCRRLLWESEVHSWPRSCRAGGRSNSRLRSGIGGGLYGQTVGGGGGSGACHATVRFPAHRVVGFLRSGKASERDSDSDSESESDSDGGDGDEGNGGVSGGGAGRRLWRIPSSHED